jgi:hypothetical protein
MLFELQSSFTMKKKKLRHKNFKLDKREPLTAADINGCIINYK